MNQSGIKADTMKIAQGIYEVLSDDDKAVIAFGMIPLQVHKLLEKLIRQKLFEIYCEQNQIVQDDKALAASLLNLNDEGKQIVIEIVKQTEADIFKCAKEAGRMLA